jgi:hypothetical protein
MSCGGESFISTFLKLLNQALLNNCTILEILLLDEKNDPFAISSAPIV